MYFAAGLGIGAGLTLLWAPRSGADTRAALRDKASEGQDLLKRQASDMRDSVTNVIERGVDALRTVSRAGADAVEKGSAAIRQ
jgi:gas vesicle protein